MVVTKNTTANNNPDPDIGGSAVSSASNTGHGLTQTVSNDGGTTTKSIRWTGFSALTVGLKLSVTLKVDTDTEGVILGGGAGNDYLLEYSVNNGGSWSTLLNRSNFTSQVVQTNSVSLSLTQDLTQVLVRETNFAFSTDPGESGQVASTTSNIRIETVLSDATFLD